MRILDLDESICSKEVLKKSKSLTQELAGLRPPGEELDDAIFAAHELVRRAEVVGASQAALTEARHQLDKVRQRKRELKIQFENRRNDLLRELENVNGPIIEYLSGEVAAGINRLRSMVIFERVPVETSMFSDKITQPVESNLEAVNEVRQLLLAFREKLRNLSTAPTEEILEKVESFSKTVNAIDPRKTETIKMDVDAAAQLEADLRPSSPTTVPMDPETRRLAERGRFEERWESILTKFPPINPNDHVKR